MCSMEWTASWQHVVRCVRWGCVYLSSLHSMWCGVCNGAVCASVPYIDVALEEVSGKSGESWLLT